jgi:hypothetical protein
MGVHEDTGGFKESVRRDTSLHRPQEFLQMKWDAVYLNKKYKMGYEKNIDRKKQVRKN